MARANHAIVGIVNLTPDSFSDGGRYQTPEKALQYTQELLQDGADVVDIGAESTRPGAEKISASEEWNRLSPVLEEMIHLAHQHQRLVSLDTRHPENAARAIALGIDWINDVSGFGEAMLAHVADSPARLVVMHSLSVPADPALTMPEDKPAVLQLSAWADATLDRLNRHGIAPERIILDPGLGFGKTIAQNWEMIHQIDKLTELWPDWLIGHSRKRFLRHVAPPGADEAALDELTVAASLYLWQSGIPFVRVHNVAAHAKARALLEGSPL